MAVMLLLVKCYNNKRCRCLLSDHLTIDQALGAYPTKKNTLIRYEHRTFVIVGIRQASAKSFSKCMDVCTGRWNANADAKFCITMDNSVYFHKILHIAKFYGCKIPSWWRSQVQMRMRNFAMFQIISRVRNYKKFRKSLVSERHWKWM